MVARQNHPAGSSHRNPTGCLQRLCSLVDKEGTKLHTFQQTMSGTHKRTGDDTSLAKEFCINTDFYLGSTASQSVHFLMKTLASFLAVGAQFADSLAYRPELRIVGMAFKTSLIGKTEHLVVDPCRIADTKHVDASIHEFL